MATFAQQFSVLLEDNEFVRPPTIAIHFPDWGASSTPPLPDQNKRAVNHSAVVRQTLRSVGKSDDKRLYGYLTQSNTELLLRDMFWWMFLQHFELLDMELRLEKYMQVLEKNHTEDLRRKQDAARRRLATHRAPKAPSNPNGGKGGRGTGRRGPRSTVMQKLAGSFGGALITQQLERQPLHLLSLHTSRHQQGGRRSGTTAVALVDTDTESEASAATSRNTCVSMPSSAGGHGYSVDKYEGGVDRHGPTAMLERAEMMPSERPQRSPTHHDHDLERAPLLKDEAIEVVRDEQDRMFSRMAFRYVAMFRRMGRDRDNYLGRLPDLFARYIVQVLLRSLPYLVELIDDDVKKSVKRRISYWINGVENDDLKGWKVGAGIKTQESITNALPSAASFASPKSLPPAIPLRPAQPSTQRPNRKSLGAPLKTGPSVTMNTALTKSAPVVAAKKVKVSTPQTTAVPHQNVQAWQGVRGHMQVLTNAVGDRGILAAGAKKQTYSKGLEEMRKVFQDLREGAGANLPPDTFISPIGMGKGGGESQRGAGVTVKVALGPAEEPDDQPALQLRRRSDPTEHTSALANFSAEPTVGWHELGKRRNSRRLAHSFAQPFNLKATSPFMMRFLVEKGCPPKKDPTLRLLAWSM